MGDPAPFRYTLFLSAALSAPAIFVVMATREARRTSAERRMARKQAFPTGPILLLSVVSLLQVGGESAARTFFNVYMDAGLSVSTELIGLLVAGGHLLAVPAALAMPVLSSRWSKYWVVVAGAVGMALCLVFMSWIPHWWMAGIGFMVLSALASIRRPAFVVTHQELVPAHWRAAVSGATSMAAGLGYAIVSFGGGYIIASSGYETLFIMGASLAVAGALLFGICFRRTPALPTERPLTSAEDWTGRNRPGGQP